MRCGLNAWHKNFIYFQISCVKCCVLRGPSSCEQSCVQRFKVQRCQDGFTCPISEARSAISVYLVQFPIGSSQLCLILMLFCWWWSTWHIVSTGLLAVIWNGLCMHSDILILQKDSLGTFPPLHFHLYQMTKTVERSQRLNALEGKMKSDICQWWFVFFQVSNRFVWDCIENNQQIQSLQVYLARFGPQTKVYRSINFFVVPWQKFIDL